MSTPRLFPRWCVDGETSLIVISFRRHRGDWSSRRFAFLSSSQTTTDISAGIDYSFQIYYQSLYVIFTLVFCLLAWYVLQFSLPLFKILWKTFYSFFSILFHVILNSSSFLHRSLQCLGIWFATIVTMTSMVVSRNIYLKAGNNIWPSILLK